MGLWGAIKKTLNSTLGTADFKPLDKIIEGQRQLAASDAVIKVLKSNTVTISEDVYVSLGTFIPKTDGSVRIKGVVRKRSAIDMTVSIKMLCEGVEVSKRGVSLEGGTGSEFEINVDGSIVSGRQYEIQMLGKVYLDALNVCASIVDSGLISVNE